jgi:putative transposase
MPDTQVPLLPTHYYHIYNHGVGKEIIFEKDADYFYLLGKIKQHILPVCHILSYCLMPNHYHFVVQIKTLQEITPFFVDKLGADKFLRKTHANPDFITHQISQQFSNLFNTYAKHFNFHKKRMGSVFKRNFRRKEITTTDYLRTLICYVHQNPVKAGLARSLKHWRFSSYPSFLDTILTDVAREETLELFGGIENFHEYHKLGVRVVLPV